MSTTAKISRVTMLLVATVFLGLGIVKLPELTLDLRGKILGWGVVLAACGQFLAAAWMAPRLTDDARISAPAITAQIVGLFIFIGTIVAGSRLDGLTPETLQLILMLGVNAMATAMLVGLLRTPKPGDTPDPAHATE